MPPKSPSKRKRVPAASSSDEEDKENREEGKSLYDLRENGHSLPNITACSAAHKRPMLVGADSRRQQPDLSNFFPAVNLTKAATASEIKKAYHRLALACHPDKHPDDPEVLRNNSHTTKTLIRAHKMKTS